MSDEKDKAIAAARAFFGEPGQVKKVEPPKEFDPSTVKRVMLDGINLINVHIGASSKRNGHYMIVNKERTKVIRPSMSQAMFNLSQKTLLRKLTDKGLDAWQEASIFMFTPKFNPAEKLFYVHDEQYYYNPYKPPSFLSAKTPSPNIEQYHNYMRLTFPCVKSREAVERWAVQSLHGKALTHLLLVGVKGAGKTFFADKIMAALHGEDNHQIASSKTHKSNFSGFDFQNKIIFEDECRFNNEELKSVVKHRLNDRATFDNKFEKTDKTRTSYASIIYACNHSKSVIVELDDRAFTIPDISETEANHNPAHIYSILQLHKRIALTNRGRDAFILGIYNYLLGKYPVTGDPKPIFVHSKTEKNLILDTDIYPRRALYDLALSGDEFTASDVHEKAMENRGYKNEGLQPPTSQDILKWSARFERKFGHPLINYYEATDSFRSGFVQV